MALSAQLGSFSTGTGAIGTTVVESGFSFQPQVVIFWWNGRTESTTTSGRADHARGIGYGISATDRACISTRSNNAAASAVANSWQNTTEAITILNNASAIDGQLDVQSMDSGGFTLVVDDQFATSYRVQYLALGGADITNVGGFSFTKTNSTGNQAISSLSFQPDIVFFMGRGLGNSASVGSDSLYYFGTAKSSSQRFVLTGGSNNSAATMRTRSYMRGDECIAAIESTVQTTDYRADFVSMDANGFTINNTESDAVTRVINGFAIKGGSFAVGTLSTQTDTSTPIAVSGLGFAPVAVILASHCQIQSTSDTTQNDDEWSFGAFTGTSTRVGIGTSDDDAQANSVVTTAEDFAETYVNINAAAGTVEGLMDVQSMDSGGFTLIMDDADPAQEFVGYIAFGSTAAPIINATAKVVGIGVVDGANTFTGVPVGGVVNAVAKVVGVGVVNGANTSTHLQIVNAVAKVVSVGVVDGANTFTPTAGYNPDPTPFHIHHTELADNTHHAVLVSNVNATELASNTHDAVLLGNIHHSEVADNVHNAVDD